MKRTIPYILALPILLATGCGSPEQEVSLGPPASDESATDSGTEAVDPPEETGQGTGEEHEGGETGHEYAFGEGAAFPYPVGAYEHEYQDGVEEDVVYTVDDVVLGAPGQVEFTLTVEVPDLGRVFGTAFLEAQCSYGEHTVSATAGEPFGELEAGTHTTDMVCDLPGSPDSVLVSVTHGLDEAHFRGPVE
ncbi:hypothetical protein [Nocardiopsis valliformis]|uniref:hypothetical protein n=1 Tax=Nocardiopsis valliformis TaxID=239974 RepID=UPI000348C5EA|nr:hypothetical protein [Nocardiopsis valliformis]